jgi:UDP-N-acetylglucosamine:LPS N-acetylglucosamine transferase
VELLRVLPAFEGCELIFLTVQPAYRTDVGDAPFHVVADATRWQKARLLWLAGQVLWVLLKRRPDVVVSTGAAPGFFALWLGKLLGARTIWLDSLANHARLSQAGCKIGSKADLWLTQWEHLAQENGPRYAGKVL